VTVANPIFLVVASGVLAAIFLVTVLWMARALRRERHRQDRRISPLPVGMALLIEDGRIAWQTESAADFLNTKAGDPLGPAIERAFGDAGVALAADLAHHGREGRPFSRVVRSGEGRLFEVASRPQGAAIRVWLYDGSAFEAALADAHPTRADRTSDPPPVPLGAREAPGGLAQLLAAGALILWKHDAEGRPLWSDGRIETLHGTITPEECLPILAAAPGHGLDGTLRLSVLSAHGRSLPVQIRQVRTPDGGHIALAVDGAAAAEAESTLARFVQTMTETFASLTVGLAIFDQEQRLQLFNPSVLDAWQLDPAWLATKPRLREVLDRLRTTRRLPDSRDYHRWRNGLLKLFESPESADYEELWTLADGSTLRVLARPHAHGALAFIFDDVTEHVHLERRYRHMQNLYRTTLDRLDEGLVVLGADGALRYLNHAFHDIWQTDDTSVTLGMHIGQLSDLCSRLTVDDDVWDRLARFATGGSSRRAWAARVVLGSGRTLSARFAPLSDGATMAIFGDATDSERVAHALSERNEALEAAEQMRGAVLDQISHRLRTPLNTIFGFAQLLADPRFGPLSDRQQTYTSGVLEAAAQLLDTITEVTELASLQIDPLDGEEGVPSVEEVLEITRDLLQRRADRARVKVEIGIDGPVGLVDCSPMRLRQIVFNLAADTIHRCPAGGTVRLGATRCEDGTVRIHTEESACPASGALSLARVEMNSLTLSLVRRLIAAEGGTLSVGEGAGGDTILIACTFPEAFAGGVSFGDLPLADETQPG